MQFNEANPLAASRLAIAARLGDEKALLTLLKKRSRVDLSDNRGWNAIHEAAASNHVGCLRYLLKKGSQYVNGRTMEGETPLLLACLHQGGVEVIQMLLDNGANMNKGNHEDFTPLHQVCKSGKLGFVKLLIEAGAELNAMNFDMWTPLHSAVFSRNIDVIEYLISKGADVNLQDDYGRTALFMACEVCDFDVVEALIKAYDFVDTRVKDGSSALMLAAQCGSLQVVQELLKRGADPNLAANDHTMAIHLAIHNGELSIVQKLLGVTSKEAILENGKKQEEKANLSLCCLAIDCENLEILRTLLNSDLGNEVLHLPTYFRTELNILFTSRHEFSYGCLTTIGFLLAYKMIDLKDDVVTYLKLLLKHGFPVNPPNSEFVPPLVALSKNAANNDVAMDCVDILMAHGVDIDYTTKCAGVPDALLAACLTANCPLLLKLLRVGSTGLPDDLLRYILVRNYLDSSLYTAVIKMTLMVNFLLELGVTKPDLYKRLHYYCHHPDRHLKLDLKKPLAEFQMCSLQQLSRVAVRRHLRQPLSVLLNKSSIPKTIKDYVTYNLI